MPPVRTQSTVIFPPTPAVPLYRMSESRIAMTGPFRTATELQKDAVPFNWTHRNQLNAFKNPLNGGALHSGGHVPAASTRQPIMPRE